MTSVSFKASTEEKPKMTERHFSSLSSEGASSRSTNTSPKVEPTCSLAHQPSSRVNQDAVPAQNETQKKPFSVPDEIAILIDKMRESPDDEELNTRAARSLRRISATPEGRDFIGESGGVQILSDCMRRFMNKKSIAITCSMTIANLTYGSIENKDRIRRSRGIDLIISLLKSTSLNSEDMAYVCLAARNITNSCIRNQVYFERHDGIVSLCKVMERHSKSLNVQVQVILCISNIGRGGKMCQMKIRSTGAIISILEAMETYADNVSIQENCLAAIASFCEGNENNQRFVGTSGGVDQVVTAMKAFKDHDKCQALACAALRYLTFDAENRVRLGTNGGVVALVSCLRSLSYDSVDKVHVLNALSNATFDHLENKQCVSRCGGINAISEVLSATKQAPLIEAGFRVLKNLTDCSVEVRKQISDSTAVPTALLCLKSNDLSAPAVEQILALILNLIPKDGQAEESMNLQKIAGLVSNTEKLHPENLTIENYAGLIQSASTRGKSDKRDGPSSGNFFRNRNRHLKKKAK